jgi:hypothetical protein
MRRLSFVVRFANLLGFASSHENSRLMTKFCDFARERTKNAQELMPCFHCFSGDSEELRTRTHEKRTSQISIDHKSGSF